MNERVVLAVLVDNGEVVSYATNEHEEPCKRVGYPTGEGYELCEYCDYPNHAERKAVEGMCGGDLYVFGHTYACEPCKEACKIAHVNIHFL